MLANSVDFKVDTDVTGNLHRNQIALVTQARTNWLWVKSVQGDESIRGWVKKTEFVSKPKPPAPSKVTTSPRPTTTVPSPSGTTLPQSFSNQPQFSNQQQFSGQPQYSGQQQFSVQRSSGQSQQRYSRQQYSQSNQRYSNGQPGTGTYSNNQSSGNRQSGGILRSNGILQRGDNFNRDYIRRNGRPPSIWETPRWESPREIMQKRRQGLLR